MYKKILLKILIFLIILVFITNCSSAMINGIQKKSSYTKNGFFNNIDEIIIYVDDDNAEGPWDGTQEHPYRFIQDGINNATEGDTVFVYNGIYFENIYINTTINLVGEDKNTTIIDSGGQHDVIYIGYPANSVTITGFTLQNSGNHTSGGAIFDAGIEIHSDFNNIVNNIISKHPIYGISLWASKGNNISQNEISLCGRSGIDFLSGPSNLIYHNIICNNEVGVSALGSSNCQDNILSYNTFTRNNKGLAMFDSGNNICYNNFINNVDFNAMSHFNFWKMKSSRNIWEGNYWDNWIGFGPKWIPGFLGFNFDWHPVKEPYPYEEVY